MLEPSGGSLGSFGHFYARRVSGVILWMCFLRHYLPVSVQRNVITLTVDVAVIGAPLYCNRITRGHAPLAPQPAPCMLRSLISYADICTLRWKNYSQLLCSELKKAWGAPILLSDMCTSGTMKRIVPFTEQDGNKSSLLLGQCSQSVPAHKQSNDLAAALFIGHILQI